MNLEYYEDMKFNGMCASLLRSIVVNAMQGIRCEVKAFGNTSATFNSLIDSIRSEIKARRRINIMHLSDYCRY